MHETVVKANFNFLWEQASKFTQLYTNLNALFALNRLTNVLWFSPQEFRMISMLYICVYKQSITFFNDIGFRLCFGKTNQHSIASRILESTTFQSNQKQNSKMNDSFFFTTEIKSLTSAVSINGMDEDHLDSVGTVSSILTRVRDVQKPKMLESITPDYLLGLGELHVPDKDLQLHSDHAQLSIDQPIGSERADLPTNTDGEQFTSILFFLEKLPAFFNAFFSSLLVTSSRCVTSMIWLELSRYGGAILGELRIPEMVSLKAPSSCTEVVHERPGFSHPAVAARVQTVSAGWIAQQLSPRHRNELEVRPPAPGATTPAADHEKFEQYAQHFDCSPVEEHSELNMLNKSEHSEDPSSDVNAFSSDADMRERPRHWVGDLPNGTGRTTPWTFFGPRDAVPQQVRQALGQRLALQQNEIPEHLLTIREGAGIEGRITVTWQLRGGASGDEEDEEHDAHMLDIAPTGAVDQLAPSTNNALAGIGGAAAGPAGAPHPTRTMTQILRAGPPAPPPRPPLTAEQRATTFTWLQDPGYLRAISWRGTGRRQREPPRDDPVNDRGARNADVFENWVGDIPEFPHEDAESAQRLRTVGVTFEHRVHGTMMHWRNTPSPRDLWATVPQDRLIPINLWNVPVPGGSTNYTGVVRNTLLQMFPEALYQLIQNAIMNVEITPPGQGAHTLTARTLLPQNLPGLREILQRGGWMPNGHIRLTVSGLRIRLHADFNRWLRALVHLLGYVVNGQLAVRQAITAIEGGLNLPFHFAIVPDNYRAEALAPPPTADGRNTGPASATRLC